MERACKQQKAEHTLHQGFIKIDLFEHGLHGVRQTYDRKEKLQGHKDETGEKGHDQKANRMRQLQISSVQPRQNGREDKQQGNDFK